MPTVLRRHITPRPWAAFCRTTRARCSASSRDIPEVQCAACQVSRSYRFTGKDGAGAHGLCGRSVRSRAGPRQWARRSLLCLALPDRPLREALPYPELGLPRASSGRAYLPPTVRSTWPPRRQTWTSCWIVSARSEAVVVGWSMGVQVALEHHASFPQRTSHLVLINGTAGRPFSSLPLPGTSVLMPPLLRRAPTLRRHRDGPPQARR